MTFNLKVSLLLFSYNIKYHRKNFIQHLYIQIQFKLKRLVSV
jgi:hypothetical protein